MSRWMTSMLATVLVLALPAGGDARPSPQDWEELGEDAREAAEVLDEAMAVPEDSIPTALLREAVCVAVLPDVIKAGLGIGGRRGEGFMTCRHDGDWSAPVIMKLTGGSFGLQIGVQSTDLVFVFLNRGAARRIFDDKFTLGGDASVAAGPVGRTAEIGTDITLESEIYTYSRSRGVFGGLTIEGAKLGVDEDDVREVYGDDIDADGLLFGGDGRTPDALRPFMEAIRRHDPR